MFKTAVSMVVTAVLLITGCGSTAVTTTAPPDSSTVSMVKPPDSASVAAATETAETPIEITPEDVAAVVDGIGNHYLRQNAVNIDYMKDVKSDDEAVKSISVDREDVKNVDSSKTGDYKVSYVVTIDKEIYANEHKKETADGDKAAEAAPKAIAEKTEGTEKEDNKETAKEDAVAETKDAEEPVAEKEHTDSAVEAVDAEEDADVEAFGGGLLDTMVIVDVDVAEEEETIITRATVDTMITVVSDDEIRELIQNGETVWDSNNEVIDSEDDLPTPTATPTPTPKPQPTEDTKPETPSGGDTYVEEPVHEEPEPQPTQPTQPSQPAHTHTWEPVYGTVHHEGTPEQGHTERRQTGTKTVVDREAFDRPIYEWHTVCSCGAILANSDEAYEHMEMGHSYGDARVQVGVEHIEAETHEEPIYEDVYVVDKPAEPGYDETVITGYRCSGCGATK